MNRHPIATFLFVGLVAGCGPGTDTGEIQGNLDIRIDMAENSGNDVDSHDTKMCVNDLGEIYVVWIDKRDGTEDIWFNRSINLGVDWLPAAIKLNRGVNNKVWNPSIACNDNGVYVVWEDDRDGELQNHNIYFNRSTDQGTTWAEKDFLLENDDEGRSFSQGPQIIAAGKRDLYVVWYDNLNGASDIILTASDNNGKDWGEPVRVDSDDPGEAFSGSPKIAATGSGNVYVVWEDTRNGNSDIYFARSENGGSSFRPDIRLDGGDEAGSSFSFSPHLCADGSNVYVVWHDARNAAEGDGGGGRDVFLNYSGDAGANWFNTAVRVDTDSPGFFNSLFPQCQAIGSTGYVAWYDNRPNGQIYDAWLRTFESGDPTGDEVRLSEPGNGFDNGNGNSTDVVMASNGTEVVIAWEDERDGALNDAESGYNDLYYNYLQAGVPQGEDLRIDTFYPANSFKTDLNVALHGNLVFSTWTDGREGTSDVFFKKLVLGTAGDTLEGEQGGATAPAR